MNLFEDFVSFSDYFKKNNLQCVASTQPLHFGKHLVLVEMTFSIWQRKSSLNASNTRTYKWDGVIVNLSNI